MADYIASLPPSFTGENALALSPPASPPGSQDLSWYTDRLIMMPSQFPQQSDNLNQGNEKLHVHLQVASKTDLLPNVYQYIRNHCVLNMSVNWR